jgi:hypothetical protein
LRAILIDMDALHKLTRELRLTEVQAASSILYDRRWACIGSRAVQVAEARTFSDGE